MSVGLAALFGGVTLSLRPFGAPRLLIDAAAWLATINVVLAVFNLVPAAPLDGGRLLRAALWRHHGDRLKASVSASNAGRGFAFVLIAFGLVLFALGGASVACGSRSWAGSCSTRRVPSAPMRCCAADWPACACETS